MVDNEKEAAIQALETPIEVLKYICRVYLDPTC